MCGCRWRRGTAARSFPGGGVVAGQASGHEPVELAGDDSQAGVEVDVQGQAADQGVEVEPADVGVEFVLDDHSFGLAGQQVSGRCHEGVGNQKGGLVAVGVGDGYLAASALLPGRLMRSSCTQGGGSGPARSMRAGAPIGGRWTGRVRLCRACAGPARTVSRRVRPPLLVSSRCGRRGGKARRASQRRWTVPPGCRKAPAPGLNAFARRPYPMPLTTRADPTALSDLGIPCADDRRSFATGSLASPTTDAQTSTESVTGNRGWRNHPAR